MLKTQTINSLTRGVSVVVKQGVQVCDIHTFTVIHSKDSKTSNNGTQILSRETVESPTLVKSGAEGKELGSRDPLHGTGNTGDGKEGAKVRCGGDN